MKMDPDYRANQKQANQNWQKNHPEYYQAYRKKHPDRTERNRLLQRIRNCRRLKQQPEPFKLDLNELIAKMDVVKGSSHANHGVFWLIPVIAKMDPVRVYPHYISDG